MRKSLGLPGLLLITLLSGCDSAQVSSEPIAAPRPVTVIVLRESLPQNVEQVAGSVAAWKTEQLGFEVSGRVVSVLEPATEVSGRTFDELGREISPGTAIAVLDLERFELQLSAAQAKLNTAESQRDAKNTELVEAVPARIGAQMANKKLADAEYDREKQLADRNVSTQSDLDQKIARRDNATAGVLLAEAEKKVTSAEVESLTAQVMEAEQDVKAAERDLQDTKLISAYNGQIAQVHKIPGSFVQAGEPVVTVQMMDPIMVEVSVSAETDQRLNYNDLVRVYLADRVDPVNGMVYEKAAIADAATRTFNVTLLLRNREIEVGLPAEADPEKIVRVRSLWKVSSETDNQKPPYFINVKSIHEDAQGAYVWKVTNRKLGEETDSANSRLELEKIRVKLGERRIPFLQTAILRELTDWGELKPEVDLIAGQFTDAHDQVLDLPDVSPESGQATAYQIRKRWMLRPGEIVRVDLSEAPIPPGLYVPANVIDSRLEERWVFRVKGDHVEKVPVEVGESVGTLKRIAPTEAGALSEGDQIVAEGALFVADGEQVNVTNRGETRP